MLLQDIIDLLGDSKGSLNDALLKTKILLYKIGKKDLATWVTSELQGYPDDAEVPAYRVVSAEVHGIIGNAAWQPRQELMPIFHLTKEQQQSITESKCRLSINAIEQAVERFRTKGGGLQMLIAPELTGAFQKPWSPGTQIHRVWCVINMIQVEAILTEVRSRLLDFVLELQGATGEATGDNEMVEIAEKLDTGAMFQHAVLSGNNTFVFGNANTITVTNTKGDLEGLLKVIRDLGLPESAVQELQAAVVDDEAAGVVPSIDAGKTSGWFVKTLKAIGDGVYKVGIGVASGTIVQAIKAHSGLP